MDKYINQSMKEVCAEIEEQQIVEDAQFEQELEQAAWNAYQQSEAFAELKRRIKLQEEQSAAWRISLLSEDF